MPNLNFPLVISISDDTSRVVQFNWFYFVLELIKQNGLFAACYALMELSMGFTIRSSDAIFAMYEPHDPRYFELKAMFKMLQAG